LRIKKGEEGGKLNDRRILVYVQKGKRRKAKGKRQKKRKGKRECSNEE
jgi:hypothetical protein